MLKEKLLRFRPKLLYLIKKIDAQYAINRSFLERAKSNDKKSSDSFKSSYIKCGAPFFKDALGVSAPFNEDYKFRKTTLKEFFPFDLQLTSSRWKTKEKVALLNGVKTQMINHIKSQQSRKLCEDSRRTRGKAQKLKFISRNSDLEQSPMMEIYKTIVNDYPDFSINWNIVSFKDLQSNHSVSECMGMWFSYLRPDINREPFTEEENLTMANAMTDPEQKNWNQIASMLDRRSSLQAFIQFHSTFARLCPSNIRWTDDEDNKLLASIDKYSCNGVVNWGKVGQVLPSRNKTQCYNRYQIIINTQGVKKGVFSRQEDRAILSFISRMGESSFSKMPKDFLPGRSLIQIKNHYNVALKHQGTVHPWTREEDKMLVEYVEKNGTNGWSEIAGMLQTHNRLSCRTRFLTINKYLTKYPDKTLEDVPSKVKRLTAVQKAARSESEVEEVTPDEKHVRSRGMGLITFERYKVKEATMYKLMRTTFNFDFGARKLSVDNLKLLVLKELFKADIGKIDRRAYMLTSSQQQKFREILTFQLDKRFLKEIKFATRHTQFLMPPNYNTCVGLRAVTITMHEQPSKENEEIKFPSPQYREELVNFQKLFFSLFYWSAMLAKLDKDELNRIHFLKYPKPNMTATEIYRSLNKRKLAINTGFYQQRSPPGSSQEVVKVYQSPSKRLKLSDR